VPARHFPRTAGLLAANAIIAGLAVAGIEPAALLAPWALFASVCLGMYLLQDDWWESPPSG
jgi:hypothetical protein